MCLRVYESVCPVEFEFMDYSPSRWNPEDIVRIRAHGLYANVKSEVRRAALLREHGSEADYFRKKLEPDAEIKIPDGIGLDLIPENVLEVYELATGQIEFGGSPEGSNVRMEGSNNWVVSPGRTATGRPTLANDPHRAVSVSSLRYAVHLVSPGMDVIGAVEPFLPEISIGHNEDIAFGLTIFSIDHEDLYVYETNPEDPDECRYRGGWESMRVERERIPVRGSPPEDATLKFTRHGPVIHEDPDSGTAFAVRAAWLEPGMAPYLGSLAYMNASSWKEFTDAMKNWGSPGENQVYADTEGNIGWHAGGRVSIRPNWDGLLPVPGDGRHEWEGPPRSRGASFGAKSLAGMVLLGERDGPPRRLSGGGKIGFEWYEPFRARRVEEVLERNPASTVSDSVALQTDSLSIPSRMLVPLLSDLFGGTIPFRPYSIS